MPAPAPSPARRLTATEIAALLGITHVTLYAWMRQGKAPPSYRIQGRRYFDQAEFEQWLAETRAGAR